MNLKQYLSDLASNEKRHCFASRCKTTLGQLYQVAYEKRRAGESLAINIERESSGVVRCEDLRPDVDWSYLRGTAPNFKAAN